MCCSQYIQQDYKDVVNLLVNVAVRKNDVQT